VDHAGSLASAAARLDQPSGRCVRQLTHWDLRGKLEGRGGCRPIGGSPCKLRASAASVKRDISPGEKADCFLRLRERYGVDAFKYRIGSECGHDLGERRGRTEEIVPAIRNGLGPGRSADGRCHELLLAEAGIEIDPAWLATATHRIGSAG
jgi:hypothetical protein